jgi:hypothetical protein
MNDTRAFVSHFGTCRDIFAPGVQITAAWIGSPNATETIDGTSMAAPHVAGVAALYLDANPGSTATQVRDAIVNNATADVVGDPGPGSPNLLLYMGFIGGDPGNMAPAAAFTYSCDVNLLCTFDGSGSTDSDGNIVDWNWTGPSGQFFANGEVVQRQFARNQSGSLTLTVTDDDGATNAISQPIVIEPPTGGNTPPVADFTFSCDANRLCTFDGTSSTDSDGSVVTWTWKWDRNGVTFGTGSVFMKQLPGPGSTNVRLEVTDDDGATSSVVKLFTVN